MADDATLASTAVEDRPTPADRPTHVTPSSSSPRRRGAGAASALLGLRTLVSLVVLLVAGVVALVGLVHHGGGGASTDGSFRTGDCVTLGTSSVRPADCSGTHDGRITAVLHQSYDTCPSGSDEFDVTDNTGNLCIDKGDGSH